MNVVITAGWCSEFTPRWRARSLLHASRPPALFLHALGRALSQANQPSTALLITDENLGLRDLGPEAAAAIAHSDLVMLSSHGQVEGGEYSLRLREGSWPVARSLTGPGPKVLVLDSCDVVERGGRVRDAGWLRGGHACPALVLGFAGPASDSYVSTTRGTAFAENIAFGMTFAQAWLDAVVATNGSRRDRPIAVAFGPTEAAARMTFDTASLGRPAAPTTADSCYWRTA